MPQVFTCRECGRSFPRRSERIGGNPPVFCSATCRYRSRSDYYRSWLNNNREKEAARRKTYNQEYKEKHPDYFHKHYAKDRERKKKQRREWYQANTERALDKARVYAKAHPDLIRRLSRKSRATRRAILKRVFVEVVEPSVVFNRDQGVCGICKRSVDPSSKWEIDHIVPIAKGGAHCYENVQLAHRKCNRSKGDTLLVHHPSLFQVALCPRL